METENKDWKPEAGGTAWVIDPVHARIIEMWVIDARGTAVKISHPKSYGSWSEGWHQAYPTADAAIGAIEIVPLEWKGEQNGK